MAIPLLRINDVTMTFGGLHAVERVSFEVGRGEIVGLIGPNGAGKTTLFNVISGYHRPTAGSVVFKEQPIGGRPPYDLAAMGIGRTFQVVRPFHGLSVLENVLIAALLKHRRRRAAEESARRILEFISLADRAGAAAGELTLGGRKRLEIGKALALEPELLLLDEVVAGLNPTEVDRTIELIRRIRSSGITILCVEHIMRVVMSISDRVVVLNYGSKIAEDVPAVVARDPEVIQAYLGEENA